MRQSRFAGQRQPEKLCDALDAIMSVDGSDEGRKPSPPQGTSSD
ncbi:hypothetical protein RAA17_04465 [Komagataeibacter rhaeticus]|nr:hypothetical protein [Komagataeibacter rhaeticus]